MKLGKSIASLMVGGMIFGSSIASAETINEAVQYVLKTDPNMAAMIYKRRAIDQEVRQARAGYMPKVDFTYGAGADKNYEPDNESFAVKTSTLSLRQNLFNGFATRGEIRRHQSRANAEAYSLQGATEYAALQVAKVYLDVLRQEDLHKLAIENNSVHERIHDQIELRSESGVDEKANLDQVNGRVALAKTNLVITDINVADAKTNYQSVVGHLPEDLSTPDTLKTFLPGSLADAQKLAVENHPTLKSADADVQATKEQHDVAKSAFYPIVDLEVDKHWDTNTDDRSGYQEDLQGMIRVRYNIFDGWKDHARKAETAELLNEAKAIKNNTKRQVVESIRLSWMAHEAADQKVALLQDYVNSAASTAEAFTKQWNLSKRTMLDVLDTEAELINAKKDLINAKYDALYAQYRILNGMGVLVPTLKMNWPAETEPVQLHTPYEAKSVKHLLLPANATRQEAIEAAEKAEIDTSFSWKTEDQSGKVSIHAPVSK